MLVLVEGGKSENPRSKERTSNKLNLHEMLSTGIKPVSQRREASAFLLLPNSAG